MTAQKDSVAQSWRIVWAIAAKDIADALRNKTILSVIIGMAVLMLSTQAFPFLVNLSARPRLIVYAAAPSDLIDSLWNDDAYQLTEVHSLHELEARLVGLNAKVLGLAIPADVQEQLERQQVPQLEGYVVWSNRHKAEELQAELEAYLEQLLGQSIRLETEGNLVYPPADGTGAMGTAGTVMILALVIIGGFLVPFLMLEEKQAHTLDALLVSPASSTQIVIGKALAGLAYSLIAAAVIVAFNLTSVVHWGVLLVSVICGAILIVPFGLALGSLLDTPQQMSLLVLVPVLLLMFPVFLAAMGVVRGTAASLLDWLPTVALGKAVLLSFSGSASLAAALPDLAIALGWSLPIYAIVAWLVRRSDR